MCGLPDGLVGVIQDAGSTSNLVAMLSARERASGYAQERGGLAGSARLMVYASEQTHSSVVKAALLAGFGRDQVRLLPTDEAYALRVDALRDAMAADLRAGAMPCAVVATIGTTATTAIDPLQAIAELAAAHRAWLHVDAALAGNALILPERRSLFTGIERADSLVFNPHKWLGATFDLSAYYVRDPAHLVRVMSTHPSYLRTAVDGEVKNLRDWGIPLGRRFRALKLWFLLRAEGVSGLQARLRRDLANARWLAEQVAAAPAWEIVAPVPLQTVCVRHVPLGLDDAAVNAHNLAWAERINRSGDAYLTPTVVSGKQIVRVSIGAEATERRDVEALWARMRHEAAAPVP
jgi:aromatic-L-amino-acid decarboxylase